MKRLSEVCKIVGVTRRTLQEYNAIGLLSPTTRTEKNYWLYDDVAINTLILIQIYLEAGYTRKEAKVLLASPKLDVAREYGRMITKLEERRKRIDGMISTLKRLQAVYSLPPSALIALSKLDAWQLYSKKNFKECFEEMIASDSDLDSEDAEDNEGFSELLATLVVLGFLKDLPLDSKEVTDCSMAFLEVWKALEEKEDGIIRTVSESAASILSIVDDIDPDLLEVIDQQCGDNASRFVVDAIKHICKSVEEQ